MAERILEQIADAKISDRSGTIARWNRAASALFGFRDEEAIGRNLGLIIPTHLRGAHWRGFEAAMASGVMKLEGRPTLTRAQHKSGKRLYVELTFALVFGASGPLARSRATPPNICRRRRLFPKRPRATGGNAPQAR